MKKNLIYAGMLLLGMTVATGCSNEESLEQVQNGNTVLAVIENGLDARTAVNDAYEVTWTADDAFSVWSNGTKAATLTLSGEAGGTTGRFTIDNNIELTEDMVALFPTSDAMSYTFATNYTSQETDAPMVGSFANGKFSFNLLTAMVRVVVDNVPAGEAVLTISSENEVLTGTASLSDGALSLPTDGAKEVTVTITNAEAGTLTFDVPVPVQNYENGLSVKLTSGTTEIFSKKTNAIDAAVGKIYVLGASVLSGADALQQAFANGGEYVLSSDVTLTEALTVASGKEVTIDLGGHTLTLSETSTTNVSDDITNNGTLTIKNGTIKSANTAVFSSQNATSLTLIDCTVSTSDARVNAVAAFGGKLTIEGGTYTNTSTQTHSQAVYVIGIKGAEATIKNANVSSSNQGAVTVLSNGTVNISGGTYKAGNWHGLFVRDSKAAYENATFEGAANWSDIYVHTSGTVNGQSYTANTQISAVSSKDDLKAAITNGGEVVLSEDVALNEALTVASGKTVSIDLNGQTLTLSETSTTNVSDDITNNGTLTIKNGTIKSANTAVFSSKDATSLTLIDCTVSTSDARVNAVAAFGGKLTIEGGTYTNTSTQTHSQAVYVIGIKGAEATIKNANVSSSNQGAVTVLSNGTVNISGGTYKAGNWHGLFVRDSKAAYENATFEGATNWSDIYVHTSGTVNNQEYTTSTSINQD